MSGCLPLKKETGTQELRPAPCRALPHSAASHHHGHPFSCFPVSLFFSISFSTRVVITLDGEELWMYMNSPGFSFRATITAFSQGSSIYLTVSQSCDTALICSFSDGLDIYMILSAHALTAAYLTFSVGDPI